MTERADAELGGRGSRVLPVDPDVDSDIDQDIDPDSGEDIDPDSGEGVLRRPGVELGRARPARRRWPRFDAWVLAVVFIGGVVGGLSRYAVTAAWPTPTGRFPWPTFAVNTLGAGALGLLLMLLAEVWRPNRYLRPLLGTGFLGAFTTFSSVMTGTGELARHGRPATAAAYLVGGVAAALGATTLGLLLGRAVVASRHRRPHPGEDGRG